MAKKRLSEAELAQREEARIMAVLTRRRQQLARLNALTDTVRQRIEEDDREMRRRYARARAKAACADK